MKELGSLLSLGLQIFVQNNSGQKSEDKHNGDISLLQPGFIPWVFLFVTRQGVSSSPEILLPCPPSPEGKM